MNEIRKKIEEYQLEVAETIGRLDKSIIEKAIRSLHTARQLENTVWLIGNGGSAATASHIANDLTKIGGMKAIAITDQTPLITAYGNDDGWEDNMFFYPLQRLSSQGDIVIAITCSGYSYNVVNAMDTSRKKIILTGNNRESPIAQMKSIATIFVDNEDIRIQEDVHLMLGHIMAGILRDEM